MHDDAQETGERSAIRGRADGLVSSLDIVVVGETPAPTPVSECHAPPSGSTSDDEAPSIGGASVGKGAVEMLPWFEAHGVTKEAAVNWLVAHFGRAGGVSKEQAESSFSYSPCVTGKVGDAGEEAILCTHAIPFMLMQKRALVTVVRNKKPVSVLDVGIGIVAMDFPDARWLDLSLILGADGKSATLADRATDGTMLVEAKSDCDAKERRANECEKKLAAHPNPESLGRKEGSQEVFPQWEGCFLMRGKSGKIEVVRKMDPPISILPAKLHDCAGGRKALQEMQKDAASAGPEMRTEWRQAITFLDKSCGQRGTYVWQKDRFIKK